MSVILYFLTVILACQCILFLYRVFYLKFIGLLHICMSPFNFYLRHLPLAFCTFALSYFFPACIFYHFIICVCFAMFLTFFILTSLSSNSNRIHFFLYCLLCLLFRLYLVIEFFCTYFATCSTV